MRNNIDQPDFFHCLKDKNQLKQNSLFISHSSAKVQTLRLVLLFHVKELRRKANSGFIFSTWLLLLRTLLNWSKNAILSKKHQKTFHLNLVNSLQDPIGKKNGTVISSIFFFFLINSRSLCDQQLCLPDFYS